MQLTQRATPYMYAGEELGLPDALIPPEAVVDPGGRDGCRAPIPWTATDGHGWGAPTWLPFVTDAATLAADQQEHDDASMLALYRRLLALRRSSDVLRVGSQASVDVGGDVVAWARRAGDDELIIAINFGEAAAAVDLPGHVVEGSARRDVAFDGRLAPDEAVIVRP